MGHKGKHSRKFKFNMKTGALCIALSAMLCGAIGLGIYSMNIAQTPQTPSPSDAVESTQGSEANNAATPVAQMQESTDATTVDTNAGAEPVELMPATNYSAVPEDAYVAGTVLVMVDGMEDAQAKLAQLSELGYAANASLDEESVNAGFIEVTLAEDANPGAASDALCAQGIITQPNFVYYLLDDESNAKADATTNEAPQTESDAAANADKSTGSEPQTSSQASVSNTEGSQSASASSQSSNAPSTLEAMSEATVNALGAASEDAPLTAQATSINDPKHDPKRDETEDWLTMVNAYGAWDSANSSPRTTVTVAVIDSGCYTSHEDLNINIVGSYNTSTGGKVFVDDHKDKQGNFDSHGTHVAGIIAAQADNGIGIAGVSYNAGLYIVHALHNNQALSSDVIKAYQNIINNRNKNGMNIRVVNMSLGVRRDGALDNGDAGVMRKIDEAYSSYGLLTVVAAGNNSNGTAYRCYPCDYSDSVLGVINLRRNGNSAIVRNTSSNFNRNLTRLKDLGAPGTDIMSTTHINNARSDYGNNTGTSMATPVVSGTAALVFSVNNDLTPAQVSSILCSSATPIRGSGKPSSVFDYSTGYGCINAEKAVRLAKAGGYIDGADSLLKGSTIELTCNGATSWSSDNKDVASVSSNGTVSGKNGGYATITADTSNGAIKKTVTVYSSSVAGLASVDSGKTSNYYVTSGTNTPEGIWSFSSSNASVATITSTGTLTARSAGTTTITATLSSNSNVKVSQQVTVKATSSDSGGGSGGGSSGESGGGSGDVTSVSMYRLYNPNSGEHFYTASAGERDMLEGIGWSYEGVGWTAPSWSNTPVYRMYNANGGEHHYTMSAGERDALVDAGWNYEGVGWYSDDQQRVPLYRDYNPNAFANNHNYTTSAGEHEMLMGVGWNSEGYAWYGI